MTTTTVVVAVTLAVGALFAAVERGPREPTLWPSCSSGAAWPADEIAGYGPEQLEHAATIVRVGAEEGFDFAGQRLAVMAAMGESGLRNLTYGDWETSGATNPDGSATTSLGLFQQQQNWGSRDDRLDPERAARMFYRALARVDGWQQLSPTIAIHRVQVNADPSHYDRWAEPSMLVASAIACAG